MNGSKHIQRYNSPLRRSFKSEHWIPAHCPGDACRSYLFRERYFLLSTWEGTHAGMRWGEEISHNCSLVDTAREFSHASQSTFIGHGVRPFARESVDLYWPTLVDHSDSELQIFCYGFWIRSARPCAVEVLVNIGLAVDDSIMD
jgi:hypothetical protein